MGVMVSTWSLLCRARGRPWLLAYPYCSCYMARPLLLLMTPSLQTRSRVRQLQRLQDPVL